MPYPLPLTRTEAYLAYKAGVIQQSDLKPSLAVPRNGIDAWLAYWTGLAADYPKREDGTPHILQEEEAYIAYLCGVINEYPEKCLRRVGAYLRYLISARWGRPDHPLNREELYLSLIKTQFVPSGDPSSDIKIDGTAKAPFVDVKMYGDTYQQTYTGKNLCGGTLAQIKNRNQGGTWNGNQYTQAGITWTVYENADGTIDRIEASGQATENGKTFYIKSFNRQQFEEQLGSEDIYTLSGCPQGGDSGYYIRVASLPWKVMLTDRGSAATGTLVPAGDYNTVFVVLCVDIPAGQVNNLVFRPQLELGSTATSYEPYVGGVPSPNPDYPQQIQTVTGEQTVTVVGKNLFDKTSQISNGYTYSATGTKDSLSTSSIQEAYISVLPNTTYTLHTDATSSQAANFRVFICEYDSGKGFIQRDVPAPSTNNTNTITTTANTYFVRLCFSTIGIDTLQFEKSALPTTYAPYSKHTYPINLGKNLFDKTKVTNGYYIDENGMLQVSARFGYSDYIPVIAGQTYTYSGATNNSSYAGKGAWYDANKQWLSSQSFGVSGQITAPSGAAYYRTTIRIEYSSNQEPYLDTYQLEVGSTATSYAPYFTPIELCKLGTYQDYIWKDGEEWKLHKATKKLTFDASEDELWIKSGQSTSSVFIGALTNLRTGGFLTTLDNGALSKMSNFRFSAEKADGVFRYNKNVGSTYMDYLFLELDTAKISTIGAFTTWLENNPSTLYAPMATDTDAEITNTALIGQLEALVAGGAENGTTYIKVNATDPNLPGLLYVEAPKYE